MIKKTTLKNGLRVLTFPMKNTRALTLLVLFGTGSRHETKDISGITHLLEHMVFKGTPKRPSTIDISRELDSVGGIFNAFTGKEYVGFWVKVENKHFDIACDVLSDMLFNSLFREEDLEKEKKVIFEEINMVKDVPQGYVLELWEKLLYGDQPAGRMISGEKETVGNITRKNILDYLKTHFITKNAIICLAGGINEEKDSAKIKKFFDKFKDQQYKPALRVIEKQSRPETLVDFRETDQTQLCLGVRAFDIFDKRKYTLAVLATILGGVMSSRLFIKIRVENSLAYHVRTTVEHYVDSGYLMTQIGVDNKRVEKAIEIVLAEYKRIKTEKVGAEELKKAKENIKGHLYLNLETSDTWSSYFAIQEIIQKEILTPEKECAMIDKVKAEDILSLAKEIFVPEKLNLALIGPFKEKLSFEKLLKL